MTLQRIEIRGVRHLIIHYKFAINNPEAKIFTRDGHYLVSVNGAEYVLGWLDNEDGKSDRIVSLIEEAIKRRKHEP